MRQNIYTFKPVVSDDLLLLGAWLKVPDVQRWWGDPARELALLEKDLNDARVDMRLVLHEGV